MKRLMLAAIASSLLAVVPAPARAQLFDRMSNPKVTVTINHPPLLGLAVDQIAFGPATGRRSSEVVDALQADFIRSGMRVIDARTLQNTLAAHQLNYAGYVDQQTAMQMAKFLGPTAMLVIDVPRAVTEHEQTSTTSKDNHNVVHTVWHSKTKASLKVSVQTIDLASGQVLQVQSFDKAAEKENTADEKCCAEYPAESQVFDMAMQEMVSDAHRLYLVWAEPQPLIFFDDKDCRMNVASDLVKAGDLAGAAREANDDLATCKGTANIDDKKLAHSYYNVGMIAFLEGRFNNAQYMFDLAEKTKDIGITTDAITQLQHAKQAAADLRAFEARRAALLGQAPVTSSDPVAGAAPASAVRDSAPAKPSPVERLKALDAAYKAGLITKDEYDKKRAEILRDM